MLCRLCSTLLDFDFATVLIDSSLTSFTLFRLFQRGTAAKEHHRSVTGKSSYLRLNVRINAFKQLICLISTAVKSQGLTSKLYQTLINMLEWKSFLCDPVSRKPFKSVYDRLFFISTRKFSQCTDRNSETNISIAIFLASVLMYQRRQILLPVGYKTARPKPGDWQWLWRHFRTRSFAKNRFLFELINSLKNGSKVHCLQENKKMSEKSVFSKAWSPEMTSQSFPVSCFWSRGFVFHRKWNLILLIH